MTNADRIRAMTDEELARFLWPPYCEYCQAEDVCDVKMDPPEYSDCVANFLKWLRMEASDGNG